MFVVFHCENCYNIRHTQILKKEVVNVLKAELEIEVVGEPDITALTDSERRLFFETLFMRVLELAKEK